MILILSCFVFTYLISSIPFGFVISKYFYGINILEHGSKSTGATNVYRCVSKPAGIVVFLLDFLKGYLPIFIFRNYLQGICDTTLNSNIVVILLGLTSLIGHSKSIFLRFKGGKSAATGLGTIFAMDYKCGFVCFVIWLIIVFSFRIVSLASIIASLSTIIFMYLFKNNSYFISYCFLGFIYVTYRHKENIKRMLKGEEKRI